ncbi:hypothetical protein FSP39_002682 [Pinctada imbricata]|uniref:Reverse transcriptase/retrotransposon-derived protein RNase H-like domain-containing protein n=1 Tax=Pinctada imbricata TaxID=66713 RepID=A0AA89C6C9_PINIB|nr:hypothetical protein FSP39_002682 [Pinctada imbricata]
MYTRFAMGMPGSETALEEMICHVLGDCLQDGCVAKLADDLNCGGETIDELAENWHRVLKCLQNSELRLSASKSIVCPCTANFLGWTLSEERISASQHKISTLASCKLPETVTGLTFLGAYKILGRVIPDCANLLVPLENAISGLQSKDAVKWTDDLVTHFRNAQSRLSADKAITLPMQSDELWIVTDGSVSKHGIGATIYAMRDGKLRLAGFFSTKLRKHKVTWLLCEVEALSIAAAIKHYSPYIIQSNHQTHLLTDSLVEHCIAQSGTYNCTGDSCGECTIKGPDCSWCRARNFGHDRCGTFTDLENRGCPADTIVRRKRSRVLRVEDRQKSDNTFVDRVFHDDVTIKGLLKELNDKPLIVESEDDDQYNNFTIAYKVAKNFPLDLYVISDPSLSMQNFRKKLQELVDDLGIELNPIYKDCVTTVQNPEYGGSKEVLNGENKFGGSKENIFAEKSLKQD